MVVRVLPWMVRLNRSATELLSGEYGGVVWSVTPSSAMFDRKSLEVNSPSLSVRKVSSFVFYCPSATAFHSRICAAASDFFRMVKTQEWRV